MNDGSGEVVGLDDWSGAVAINGKLYLSEISGRIDILVPVLELSGDAEDLLLDLHYCLLSPRSWRAVTVRNVVRSILSLFESNSDSLVFGLGGRIPSSLNAEEILREWKRDLLKLITVSELVEKLTFTRGPRNLGGQ